VRVHLPQRRVQWLNCCDILFKCHCVELRSRLSTDHSSPDIYGTKFFALQEKTSNRVL
jgi:hypothetical protein